MYSSARTAAIGSSNRLKNPISRSDSRSSDYDLEVGERTPLLISKVGSESSSFERRERQLQTVQTTALLGIMTLLLFLLLGVIIAVYLLLLEVPHPWPVSHPFYMVERHIWWKHPSAMEVAPLEKRAAQNVIVLHTRSEPCHDQTTCVRNVQQLQDDAWTRNGSHIPYNFLIGGDGKTYEGRGWRGQHGFSALPGNNDTIVVGIIGTYTDQRPDSVMYAETKALITESIRRYSLSPSYRLYGVIDTSMPENDGAALYGELQQWKHWRGFVTI